MDKTQQNSKCRLYGDRDETIKHIISEYSKLAERKYKTKNDWLEKGIYLELFKKWYMHNPESVLENVSHKILWDFEIQTSPILG